jgi:hypothetical protein
MRFWLDVSSATATEATEAVRIWGFVAFVAIVVIGPPPGKRRSGAEFTGTPCQKRADGLSLLNLSRELAYRMR